MATTVMFSKFIKICLKFVVAMALLSIDQDAQVYALSPSKSWAFHAAKKHGQPVVIKARRNNSQMSPHHQARWRSEGNRLLASPSDMDMFFASSTTATSLSSAATTTKNDSTVSADADQYDLNSAKSDCRRRLLGSQELLMLPRQYGPKQHLHPFPQMNHVSVAVISATPSAEQIRRVIVGSTLPAHPVLRCAVMGDGQPDRRIDLLQMVRQGEPNPLTFAAPKDCKDMAFTVDDILRVVDVVVDDATMENDALRRQALTQSWQNAFARDLDNGSWCNVHQGPLWKLELHQLLSTGGTSSTDVPCALLFSFNHAISDQSSANRLIDEILRGLAEMEGDSRQGRFTPSKKQDMPMALEDSVLGLDQRWNDVKANGISFKTIQYVATKAGEEFKAPVVLTDAATSSSSSSKSNMLGALEIISGRAAGGEDRASQQRKSTLEFTTLSRETTKALLQSCRENGVSITNALTAAMTLTVTDHIDGGTMKNKSRNYKVLQSLDMRRFGQKLDKGETVACMAGSMDLMHGPVPDRSGLALRKNPTQRRLDAFWALAREGKAQTEAFVQAGFPSEAVRVFDFAMSIADLTNLVYWKGQSNTDKGRAYSAGVTNVGVYERQLAFQREDQADRDVIKTQHGRYKVEDIYFATPHTQTGCLFLVSGMSIDGELKLTFNPVEPMVSEATNKQFAADFLELLEIVAGARKVDARPENGLLGLDFPLPDNILTTAAIIIGLATVASHGGAWIDFYQSLMQMKANVADPADFSAALNFWIFFAVGHPLLPPILWISDVLHGTPGPKIADLVPVLFLAGNLAAIWAISSFNDLRNAVNIAVVAAFFAYVGAGLGGQAGLGDFNLALDDSYEGQVVNGCPAYNDVRQSSMDGFDLKKYQGLWYEHKFHDWTQFKEVYDTTLKIKLTDDGTGWVDDFAVKGPAPDAAPLSWDKSPVANGAHYFLFGRVDPKDPPGVLRESGFGVEFPNYIVDIKKDRTTGEYKEAIQFQCLERGGVRVFEGINFMSRSPTMSNEELSAMHARAEKAGMYPYGASPEQMHTVARRPVGAPEIDNNWQAMWRAIGFDRLLELLTESIEDGGR